MMSSGEQREWLAFEVRSRLLHRVSRPERLLLLDEGEPGEALRRQHPLREGGVSPFVSDLLEA